MRSMWRGSWCDETGLNPKKRYTTVYLCTIMEIRGEEIKEIRKEGELMAGISVDISQGLLEWLADKIDIDKIKGETVDIFNKWVNGEKKPTFSQIEKFSKETKIPLGYFFLQQPPEESFDILEYRTIESIELQNPSRNLLDTINNMQSVQDWMREYLISEQSDKLSYVGSLANEKDVNRIALEMRTELGLPIDWFSSVKDSWEAFKMLREHFESSGIIVMVNGVVGQNTHRKLDVKEFRAFTLVDEYAPLIFINASDSKSGKLFSLVHEAVHIWLGVDSLYNGTLGNEQVSDVETICNAVAAEILVPQTAFERYWGAREHEEELFETIARVAKIFNCGSIVIARRALDNDFISKKNYEEIVSQAIAAYQNSEGKKESGGHYYNTAGVRFDKRFIIALDNSIHSGKTLFTEAYRLTGTNRTTFSKIADNARGIDV